MKSTVKKHILALTLASYCLLAQWQIAFADVPPSPISIAAPNNTQSNAIPSYIFIGGSVAIVCIWIATFFILRWIKKKNDNR